MKGKGFLVWFWLAVPALGWAAEWGLLEPSPMPGRGGVGPVHSSKMFVVTAPVVRGEAQLPVALTHPRGAFAVVLGDRPVQAWTRGKQLPRREFVEPELGAMDLPGEGVRFDLSALEPEEHTLKLSGLSKPSVELVVAEPESPLTLEVQVKPLAVRVGDEVTITAKLADAEPVAGAQVVAKLASFAVVQLRDDGQGGDEVAGDGTFTGRFVAPQVQGMEAVELRVEARGQRQRGGAFQRLATAAVMVTQPASGFAERGVEVTPDTLEVALLPARGRFRVEVLYGAKGVSFAWAQEDLQLEGQAARTFLPRPPATWGADRALVRLLNLETMGVEAETEVELIPLAAPPDFQAQIQQAPALPPSKAEAARRFGDPR